MITMTLETTISMIIGIIIMIGFIGAIYNLFEKSYPKVEHIVLLAILTAITVVAQFIGAFIPYVSISPFIIIMIGIVYGKDNGFIVGTLFILVFDIISGSGLGSWTLFQMIAFGLMGFTSGILSTRLDHPIYRVLYGVLWGFLYGWITNLSMFFFMPLTTSTLISTYAASLYIDGARAIITAILLILAYTWFKDIFRRPLKHFMLEANENENNNEGNKNT